MLLKKGAICTCIPPEENNEEISPTCGKHTHILNHVTLLMGSEMHHHAEGQHEDCVSKSLHPGGLGYHKALEAAPQSSRITPLLSK